MYKRVYLFLDLQVADDSCHALNPRIVHLVAKVCPPDLWRIQQPTCSVLARLAEQTLDSQSFLRKLQVPAPVENMRFRLIITSPRVRRLLQNIFRTFRQCFICTHVTHNNRAALRQKWCRGVTAPLSVFGSMSVTKINLSTE